VTIVCATSGRTPIRVTAAAPQDQDGVREQHDQHERCEKAGDALDGGLRDQRYGEAEQRRTQHNQPEALEQAGLCVTKRVGG
jgi:hypothetical protein